MKLEVVQSTAFKQTAEDSSKLPAKDKVFVQAGRIFEIHSWKLVSPTHLRVALLGETLGDPARNAWCIFASHVRLVNSQGAVIPIRPGTTTLTNTLPVTKLLGVPYKSQLDNALNPTGACNVTCFAMAMAYWKIKRESNVGQIEDELYQYMENKNLSRHDPEDLVKMATAYRLQDAFTTRGKLADIRKAIAEGKPCIIHVYFTSFGHIIVVRGYDQAGFYVNDPYGEWTSSGYRQDLSGENLYYSNWLIQSKCSPEGDDFLWLHRLSKAE